MNINLSPTVKATFSVKMWLFEMRQTLGNPENVALFLFVAILTQWNRFLWLDINAWLEVCYNFLLCKWWFSLKTKTNCEYLYGTVSGERKIINSWKFQARFKL